MYNTYIGLPAARILDDYHLDKNDLRMIDEPPGTLVGISFYKTTNGKSKKEVTIWLENSPKLFDHNRSWTIETIRESLTTNVTIQDAD